MRTDGFIWDDGELSRKIRQACRVARKAGYRYLWIDSCCIDKTSSSELSESINSMYQWYGRANVCFAHLADVPSDDDPRAAQSAFRRSRWFTRGWTLQELIAPLNVIFLSDDWNVIGTKLTLVSPIEDITSIPAEALLHTKSLDDFSVAQRLSWAAKRATTRVEDQAYSLLGTFDITMPTLYGEGERAFRRLQEEIVRRVPDQSLFAWTDVYQGSDVHRRSTAGVEKYSLSLYRYGVSLFSTSINRFAADSKDIAVVSPAILHQFGRSDLLSAEYTPTPQGIRTQLPVLPLTGLFPHVEIIYQGKVPESQWYVAILGCKHRHSPGCLLGRVCYIPPSDSGIELLCPGYVRISPTPGRGSHQPDLFPLSLATIERCRDAIHIKTVYISHPERATRQLGDARLQPHETINLVLRKATRDDLRAQGYAVELRNPDEGHPTTHMLTLSNDDHTITVEYRHTLEDDGRKLRIEGDVKISRRALDEVEDVEADVRSVRWWDYSRSWRPSLDEKEVVFTLAGKQLTLKLCLDWAAPSHYFPHVEVVRMEETTPAALLE
ncbi:heterokaryon incompatibility protein-domain-containing protein [Dichomitus squalens]|uniref:Heterokaryon incompatibility protein-domain-containing protein n=1 Tax=Dichomitus squalens TaxID=114155 RepID=A0A4Q9PGW7_9APHY|nr:heterokaryon incompatibility protein-domain-containing protein [Dichomitus squalens]